MRGLFQSMTQQTLSIVRLVSRERYCRKTAQGSHMAGILLQDLPKDLLRGFPIVGYEGGRCFFHTLALRIRKAGALEGNGGVRILIKVGEDIAVGKPSVMIMRHFLQHAAYLLARLRSASVAPVGACQIHARMRKIGSAAKHIFERRNALGDFVLVQQRSAQQPEAIQLSRDLCAERAQPALGGSGAAGAQRRVRSG
ncbi:MAG: hypothetical protein WA642_04100 [Steroidobacteraceae bacterium]